MTALNQFPAKGGVSDHISPRTIVTGYPTPDYNHLKLEIGSYVQVFDDPNPTNTQRPRTIGAIRVVILFVFIDARPINRSCLDDKGAVDLNKIAPDPTFI